MALPPGASAALGHQLRDAGVKVVDLGSDFRLDTASRYEQAYGSPHPSPGELATWQYGLPELFALDGRSAVAAPGCYPTAVLLAIAPLVTAGMVERTGIVADCFSGVSGAGRTLRDEFLFGEVAEGVRAYGVTTHRHRPEIEMALDLLTADQVGGGPTMVTFTPHLAPMQRGLLATVTARLCAGVQPSAPGQLLNRFYATAPFVEVIDRPPQTRWTVGSNRALVAAFVDSRQPVVIVQCALDNLLKGAAGQAIQAANLMLGYPETDGLPMAGWMP
jgi:N-acetyl-gamma-glutamyl-phosphate reductase